MSETQTICVIFLGIADFAFNLAGWINVLADYSVGDKPPKPLLITLIVVDVITVLFLILGAIGVFL